MDRAKGRIGQDLRKRLLSRQAGVWFGAIVSQIVIIGGVLAWGILLGTSATQALPRTPAAAITMWVSDPHWNIAPWMEIGQETATIDISASRQSVAYGLAHPDAEAVVVLWGDAQLTDLHQIADGPFTPAPGSYRQVQVPSQQFTENVNALFDQYVIEPSPASNSIAAQVFVVRAGDYYTPSDYQAPLPVVGKVSASLYTQTSTGWSAYVPPIGVAGVNVCPAIPGQLPAAIASVLARRLRPWYASTCPTPRPTVQVALGMGEHFGDSSLPPTGTVPANGNLIWTDQGSPPAGYISSFWIDIGDSAIAAAAQRNLLFSGVLIATAAGLLAAWLIAGVTFVVKHTAVRPTRTKESRQPLNAAEPQSRAIQPEIRHTGDCGEYGNWP